MEAEFTARDYQVELFEKSVESDSIVFLRTGAGKTFIAVMLIKEVLHELIPPYELGGKRAIFLVPRVPLVTQQAKMVRDHVSANVGEYCGSHGVDYWGNDEWQKILREFQVLVMTPQILVNMLDNGFIPLRKVNLIIFDECHNATGDHPYSMVMRHLSANMAGGGTSKPRILGLSASILNTKCKPMKLAKMMKDLEVSFGAKIVASSDETSVDRFATNPTELVVVCADKAQPSAIEARILDAINRGQREIDELKSKFSAMSPSKHKKDIELFEFSLRDMDEEGFSAMTRMQVSPKQVFKNLRAILDILGLDCMTLLLGELILSMNAFDEDSQIDAFKIKAKRIIEKYLMELQDIVMSRGFGQSKITTKLARLLEIIRNLDWHPSSSNLPQRARTIVFVEQRVVSWTLSKFLHNWKMDNASCRHIQVQFMVGNALRQSILKLQYDDQKMAKQHTVLEQFRSGVLNLLVSTNVVEEGLDIPRCNVVIRFDKPKTFCSYVQSKGRARASEAKYFLLVEEKDSVQLCSDLGDYQAIEKMIADMCIERPAPSDVSMIDHNLAKSKFPPFYVDGVHGAVLTLESAAATLNRYCSHLPCDRFTKLVPKWKVIKELGKVQFIMKFPHGCPIEEKAIGEFMQNNKLAKKAAAFKACKMLYQEGELDKHLLPNSNYWERYKPDLGIFDDEVVFDNSKPGTRQRRQFYNVQRVDELSECFPADGIQCYLHPVISYQEQPNGYGAHRFFFGILSRKEISMPWPCLFHTPRGKVTMQLDKKQNVLLTRDQLDGLMTCHQYLWEEVLDGIQCPMEFDKMSPFSVLTVPLQVCYSSGIDNLIEIDWRYVASVRDAVSTKEWNNWKPGAVVRPTHRSAGTFYVENVRHDMSPITKFPSSEYTSFAGYYKDKYNVVVKDLQQPLLKVAHVSCSTNFVLCRDKIVKKEKNVKGGDIYHIPELCKILAITIDQLIPLLALPSFLWRLQWLMRSQNLMTLLSREAHIPFNVGPIPHCSQVDQVEALHKAGEACNKNLLLRYSTLAAADSIPWIFLKATTLLGANDLINMERLETLGDSFLKYATSVRLYCQYPRLNEGILSTLRSKIVCNYNLYACAKRTCLPQCLNASGFNMARWVPPGYCLQKDMLDMLISLRVPLYLWKYASIFNDVDPAGICRDVVIQLLLEKHAETKNVKAPANVPEVQAGLVYNEYDRQFIGDKNVADVVEAMIGACLVSGGQSDALKFTKWLGLRLTPPDVDLEYGIPWNPPENALVARSVMRGTLNMLYATMESFEDLLGYTFKEKSFLRQALCHPSFTRHVVTNSYQQLEFVGDAVLDYLVTVNLYCMEKEFSPGQMTDIRSSVVDTTTFAYLAVRNNFHQYLQYMSPSLFKSVMRYVEKVQFMVHPKDSLYLLSEDECMELEDIECPKALCDVFESVAGAIYIDSGMDLEAVWKVYYKMMADVMTRYTVDTPISPVRKLYEENPAVEFSKPEKLETKYRVTVKCNGVEYTGLGKTKYIAKNSAAKCALRRIQKR